MTIEPLTSTMVPGQRPRALLVGDVSVRPVGLERALIHAGFEIGEAALGAQVASPPDVVLLTAAGEVDAAGALEVLRQHLPLGVPVVVTLEEHGPDAITRILEAGAADALRAPVDLAELAARMACRVRGGRESAQAVRSAEQTSRLFDVFQDIAVAHRPEEMLQTLVRRLGDVLGLSHCACLFVSPGHTEGRLVAVHENPRLRDTAVDLLDYPEALEAVRTVATVAIPDVLSHPLFLRARTRWLDAGVAPDVRSAAAIPLSQQGRPVGVLVLRTPLAEPLRPEVLRFAERLVRGTARVMESQERRAAIYRRQAGPDMVDPLTGCASLDALDHRLQEEFERGRRYGLRFSLVLLDVDGLAEINSQAGMEAGDRALADIGSILQREVRGPDFVARYAGDEFALVLPETDLDGARRTVGRIRNRIAQHPFFALAPGQRPTLSAGVVTFPHPTAVQTEDLFALAETALLKAKRNSPDGIGVAETAAA